MNARVAAATLLLFIPALAGAAPMKAGVNVPCLEKAVKGEAPAPGAWITLGYLDQVRGDLKAALEKYKKAFGAGAKDLANAPLDFTLVGDVIWIQDEACKVPVPKQGADATVAANDAKGPVPPKYPVALNGIASEGNATVNAVVGPDGRVLRVQVTDTSAGPPQVNTTAQSTTPGQMDGERLMSRVQFALVAIQTVRDYKFPEGNSGKTWTKKFIFQPPKDLLSNSDGLLPGTLDTTAKSHQDPMGGGKKPN